MKIKGVLFESVSGEFINSTKDQFPYIESTINTLDDNFNWWKENWKTVEQLILQKLKKTKTKFISITSKFTFFHGHDDEPEDIIWTGPAMVYVIEGATPEDVAKVKESFGGVFKGHKIFAYENQLIVLF